MHRARVFAAAMLLMLAAGTVCQSQTSFSPFVSRLKADVAENRIKLTWKDSADLKGDCLVYRSTEEITDANLAKAALIATVPSGIEFYIDAPAEEKGYYYAVIVQDSAGKQYRILIPFRNITSAAVAVVTTAPEEALAARITGITAAVSGEDSIVLSFQSSKTDRDLIAFWSTSPLAGGEDLLRGASKAGLDPGVSSYKVAVVRGVDYFFAVLDAGLFKIGRIPLVPGQNTTTTPVLIPLPPGASVSTAPLVRRALPLPSLQLAESEGSGFSLPAESSYTLPEEKPVSGATTQAIAELMTMAGGGRSQTAGIMVLDDDKTPAAGGERTALQTIVNGQFGKADYGETERLIRDFLSISRAPQIEARARFYLGQVILLQKRPREAAMEFLMAQDQFYHETQPWLDACLRQLDQGQ